MAEKLVRDLIPQYIAAKNEKVPPWRVVHGARAAEFLAAKLYEEMAELKEALERLRKENQTSLTKTPSLATTRACVREAADLVEVLYTMFGRDDVEEARENKRNERGGFDHHVVMEFEDKSKENGPHNGHETGCKGLCRGCAG